MTDEEIREIRTKALKDDLASINNRLHHAFNQGFELGRKSTTPKEKTAHWVNKTLIYKGETEGERDCYAGTCSACGCVQECWNYCSGCGARMVEQQEKSESEHDHEVVKAYNGGQAYILDKIRTEVEALYNTKNYLDGRGVTVLDCLKIINKYRGDTE